MLTHNQLFPLISIEYDTVDDLLDIFQLTIGKTVASDYEHIEDNLLSAMDLVKIILLGARGVGKTSIIQFVWNNFSEEYVPTESKQVYFSSVIYNDRLYEVKISDLPMIPYFPANSYCEWADFRFYGLRNATAYILVFDLSNLDSFQYIRVIRDQIAESRDMRNVPILVIGNKHDQLRNSGGALNPSGAAAAVVSGTNIVSGGTAATTTTGVYFTPGSTNSSSNSAAGGNCGSTSSNVNYADMREKRKEIMTVVKKQWKCTYMDCSAKFNWKVVAVFKEIIKIIDSVHTATGGKSGGTGHSGAAGHHHLHSTIVIGNSSSSAVTTNREQSSNRQRCVVL